MILGIRGSQGNTCTRAKVETRGLWSARRSLNLEDVLCGAVANCPATEMRLMALSTPARQLSWKDQRDLPASTGQRHGLHLHLQLSHAAAL